jgi:hypothetical protein
MISSEMNEFEFPGENEEWERLYLLVILAMESFNEGWSEFVPENSGYSPSPRFGKIEECQANLNYATMTLTVDGVPFPSDQPKPSTQSSS